MERDDLVTALTAAFTARPEVVEVQIDGSLGRGEGDDHSDVDLVVVVADDAVRAITSAVPEIVRSACDPVLIRPLPFVTLVVTREWLRLDVAVRPVSQGPFPLGSDADAALGVVEEFLRCLGLNPVAIARREWVSGVLGTNLMIGLLTDLMQLENGTRRFGGALRLSERLTAEQRAVVAALPPLHADGDSIHAVQVALARDFLPRARRLSSTLGFEYPDELEAALLDHLRRHGVEL
jgi:predicted nucleotidyltransferase